MHELTRYEDARKALAICASIDEVKDIQDKSEAMRLYARMSENTELEVYASTIKLRAQVRLGEIIAGMEKAPSGRAAVSLPTGGKSKTEALSDAGISTSSAHRYEQAASIPEKVLDGYIANATASRKPVTLAAAVAIVNPPRPKTPAATVSVPPVVSTPSVTETVTISKEKYDEMTTMVEDAHADSLALETVFDADDKLAAAAAEIRSLNAQLSGYKSRFEGEQNKNNELVRLLKNKDRQIAILEKLVESLKLETLPL